MQPLRKLFDLLPEPALLRTIAWQYRLFEPELARYRQFVPPGHTAVDIGGWWGPWSYWLARRADRVVTIEPVEHVAGFLRRTLPANVTVHNVAVSDARGEASLWVPTAGKGSEGRSAIGTTGAVGTVPVTVPTITLDSLALDDVAFIKLDVEGHELAVLAGATDTIARCRPTLLIEIEEREGVSVHDVFDRVCGLGYSGRFLARRAWRPLAEFDVEKHQRRHQAGVRRRGYVGNFFLGRGYVNNFVFDPVQPREEEDPR